MMICHDHSHSKLLCKGNFLCSRNAVVAGDYRIDPCILRILNQMLVDAIAVLQAVWDHRIRCGADAPQRRYQNVRGIYAVYIIVADNPDTEALAYLFLQQRYCVSHSFHQIRIRQLIYRPAEIFPHLFFTHSCPAPNQPHSHGTD